MIIQSTCAAITQGRATVIRYFLALTLILAFSNANAIYSITTNNLNFPDVGVGNVSSGMLLSITNLNTDQEFFHLFIDSISITPSSDFTVVVDSCTVLSPLSQSQFCTIGVAFAPGSSGLKNASLVINGRDVATPFTETVALSGTGVTGFPAFDPIGTSLGMGAVPLNTTSDPFPVTVRNYGNAAADINGITIGAPFSQTNNCPATLSAGATCTITVTATPTTLGIASSTLRIDGTGPQGSTVDFKTVSLTSEGVILTSSQSLLNFSNVQPGSTSSPQSITVTNVGNSDLSGTDISITGDFAQTNNCSPTLSLGENCTITVTATPTTIGSIAGSLMISGSAFNGTVSQSISLNANGTDALLSVSPQNIVLPDTLAGSTSSTRTVTVSNLGNSSISNFSISTTGVFSQSNDCPATLTDSSSCAISVTASPTSIGPYSGTIILSGTGPFSDINQTVSLSVNALSGILNASPGTLNFPDTPVGSSSSPQIITVTNLGNVTLEGLSINSSTIFTQTSDCATSLAPNESCSVSVTANPTVGGDISGTLDLTANSGGQTTTTTVFLNLAATTGNLSASDTQLMFPDATVDASTQPQVVTVTNQGNASLTINSITTDGDFSQTNNCGGEITAGSSCDIAVVFTPQSTGTSSGILNIDTNEGLSTIVLSGSADAPSPSSNPVADLLGSFVGENPNLLSLVDVIAEACPSGRLNDRLQEDCNAVVGAASDGDVNTTEALNQVNPESTTKANNTTRQGGESQIRNLGTRIAALRAGARGLSFQGLDLLIDGKNLPISLIADAYRNAKHGGAASADNQLLASRLGVFVTGDISSGEKDETDLESGLDFDTVGITIGADYRITNQFILGGAVGFIDTEAELKNDAGDMDTQGYSLSLFGTYYSPQHYFLDFSATFGSNNFEQKRNIVYTLDGLADVNQSLKADYDGDMMSLFVGSGYDFNRGPWSFGPRVDLEYIKSDVDGFTEEVSDPTADGGGWATRVEATDQRWLTLNLGGKVSYTQSMDWGVLIPYARLDWLHEFEDDSQVINAHFVEDPAGMAIEIQTDETDQDYLRLRFGTSAQFQNGVIGFIDYGTILAHSEWSAHTISAGLRMEF